LALASGELRREVLGAIRKADLAEPIESLLTALMTSHTRSE
jgi:hypothetical protein